MRKILAAPLLFLSFLSCAQVQERPTAPSNAVVIGETQTPDQVAAAAALQAAQQAVKDAQAAVEKANAEAAKPAVVVEEELTPAEQAAFAAGGNPNRTLLVYGTPTTGGHVSGAGTYPRYTYVQFSANPNAGWYLLKWNDGNTNQVRAVVLRSNMTFTATFAQGSPPPTTSLVTVGWNGVVGCTNYYVWNGPSLTNYTKRVTANNQTKKQLTVGVGSTNHIAVQAIDSTTGLVSVYSTELVYVAP